MNHQNVPSSGAVINRQSPGCWSRVPQMGCAGLLGETEGCKLWHGDLGLGTLIAAENRSHGKTLQIFRVRKFCILLCCLRVGQLQTQELRTLIRGTL